MSVLRSAAREGAGCGVVLVALVLMSWGVIGALAWGITKVIGGYAAP